MMQQILTNQKEILERLDKIESYFELDGISKNKETEMQSVLKITKELSKENEIVPEKEILKNSKLSPLSIKEALLNLMKRGDIFEPKTAHYQVI